MTLGRTNPQASNSPIQKSEQTASFWSTSETDLFSVLDSSPDGLSAGVAASRLEIIGGSRFGVRRRFESFDSLVAQFKSPIIIILLVATLVSVVLGDYVDALIIFVIVFASSLLGYWQEHSASEAVKSLLARVAVAAEVRRLDQVVTIPIEQVVPGDVVLLNAGDVVPGDCRIIDADSLLVDEATLTGEAFPVQKQPGVVDQDAPLPTRTNAVFMGSHVVSGRGTALVVRSGSETELGHVSTELARKPKPTGFERGITAFGYLLGRATATLVASIFVVNLLLHRPVLDSLLFSLALAVGLTPQMLPVIVSISLATGARLMAKQHVIVKRLDAIEDLGGMTVLCTDKTGTLTSGKVSLVSALDPNGTVDDYVGRLAWINARYQTGYTNPLDDAILDSVSFDEEKIEQVDQVPYDFTRKRLSVLVREDGKAILVTKGALESVLSVCSSTRIGNVSQNLETIRTKITNEFERLSSEGYRVLGIATREMTQATACTAVDEVDMVFAGLLAFSDPPKEGAAEAVRDLAGLGISVRMITGDNPLAAAHIGAAVGLDPTHVLTGSKIDLLSDQELASSVGDVAIFSEINPVQKERLVLALQRAGETVGFLGDGINDAPALHAADVGISVDTAVDVAKQSAAIVLLENHLSVVGDGVRLGRRTFANTLKYINVTTSANFGNMLSMAAAAIFLPFLPMLPRQILLLNFLSDFPGTTIASDNVDPEQVEVPQSWNISTIRRNMIFFGSISSIFDMTTFIILRQVFNARPEVFRSGWFIESVLTELAVMLVLRTRRPFFRSRPGRALMISSAVVAVITLAMPFSRISTFLGMTALSPSIVLSLLAIASAYILVTELAKQRIIRRGLI